MTNNVWTVFYFILETFLKDTVESCLYALGLYFKLSRRCIWKNTLSGGGQKIPLYEPTRFSWLVVYYVASTFMMEQKWRRNLWNRFDFCSCQDLIVLQVHMHTRPLISFTNSFLAFLKCPPPPLLYPCA